MPDRLYTVQEAAEALHATVTVSAVRKAINESRLAAVRIGRRYYVSEKELRRFAEWPALASRPVSGNGQTTALGLSSTATSPVVSDGRVMAEQAAEDLLKRLCATTSGPKQSAGGQQRSPRKSRSEKS